MTSDKLLVFDCDSTLSGVEGVDELARFRGEDVFRQVENMTDLAMNGEIPLDEVFARRLDLIRPTQAECEQIAGMYLQNEATGLRELLKEAARLGWHPVIVSGGFTPCIRPFAQAIGIDEIFAVDLVFDANGSYAGFDTDAPTSRRGGKPEIVRLLKERYQPKRTILVGDGGSDLEAKPEVDCLVGFGAFVARDNVIRGADDFVYSMSELMCHLVEP
jgi:phosphoserine phosphatase